MWSANFSFPIAFPKPASPNNHATVLFAQWSDSATNKGVNCTSSAQTQINTGTGPWMPSQLATDPDYGVQKIFTILYINASGVLKLVVANDADQINFS
ncbi:MAG: hypothetical protein ABSE99_06420 [Terracidiphilus sp.]|jgi:hypothetical protein